MKNVQKNGQTLIDCSKKMKEKKSKNWEKTIVQKKNCSKKMVLKKSSKNCLQKKLYKQIDSN